MEQDIKISFTSPKLTKESPPSAPTPKSSLPETTTTSPSWCAISNALKAEICFAMKGVTFHYFQNTMNELPDLLEVIFPNSIRAGNMKLVCIKLA